MANTYGRRKPQIKKQDLYMMTALWMEQSPWAMKPTNKPTDPQRVVGAVFVRPNGRVLSVDCSRSNDGGSVHGAIRALIKYPDMIEGCQVYLSRQPCAHCVKMLVQARVTKVFYLPLKPEKDQKEENKSVDALFKVSPVSREVYVPNITKDDLKELKRARKKNPYGTRELRGYKNQKIQNTVQWQKWKKEIADVLCWDEYSDKEIKKQVDEDMKRFFEWFDLGILATGKTKDMKWKKGRKRAGGTSAEDGQRTAKRQRKNDDEVKEDQKVANHLSRLAQMLSYRTDDPNFGVGCVITLDDEKEIVSIGWNGFPSKALYGNHPRGSRKDVSARKKYPHIIYALENAVVCRNRRGIEGSMVYHTIKPSDENTSILKQLGAKQLVIPSGERGKLEVVTL